MEEDYFEGEVTHIYFSNTSNHYYVLQIKVEETNTLYSEKEIVVTGSFSQIHEGSTYRFFGELTQHPKYGLQFKANRYENSQITTKKGLVRYLSSHSFPGVGKVLAERIVDQFGEETISTILTNPEALSKVKGLNRKTRLIIEETLEEEQGSQQVWIQLAQWGFSNTMISRIYEKYKSLTLSLIQENPYILAEDIRSINFQRADQLARLLKFDYRDPLRLASSLIYSLRESLYASGDTVMEVSQLLWQAVNLLNTNQEEAPITEEEVKIALFKEEQEKKIILTTEQQVLVATLPQLYYSERTIAERLFSLSEASETSPSEEEVNHYLEELNKKSHFQYAEKQKEAIKKALRHRLSILTGGPGTGKTTVINAIVQAFSDFYDFNLDAEGWNEEEDGPYPVVLVAPTGRAAKRMSELTALPAQTIHHLLHLTLDDDNGSVIENEVEPIEGKLVIIDEMSMVDTWLFERLMINLSDDVTVVLVGDKDQLPSVGPGQVLTDLLADGHLPYTELDVIFRQDENSSISTLAQEVRLGQVTSDFYAQHGDRNFIRSSPENLSQMVASIAKRAMDRGYSLFDFQVLAPMYKGIAGIDNFNRLLQETLNPHKTTTQREVVFGEGIYRVNDKVIQLKNDNEKRVYNGDIGKIVGIYYSNENESKQDELLVDFDGNEVLFTRNEWNQLSLAYCTSIHKAQGSEFPIVILAMSRHHNRMLQRNLIYTAVTRAKKSLVLIGEEEAFQKAIQSDPIRRLTKLRDFLDDVFETSEEKEEDRQTKAVKKFEQSLKEDSEGGDEKEEDNRQEDGLPQEKIQSYILTPDLVENNSISPMIGMEGISPYTD